MIPFDQLQAARARLASHVRRTPVVIAVGGGALICGVASLRAAISRLITMLRVVAEGAGALPYAALEQLPPGPKTVAVVSGGNIARSLVAELLVESERA